MRPNCLAKVSQWWEAFHATLRPNSSTAAIAASQGPGLRNAARPAGVQANQRTMPGARNRAEYLDSAARPAAAPAASHQGVEPARVAFNAHHKVTVQNKAAGASGTARKPPAATRSMALYQMPARVAVGRCAPASLARSKTTTPMIAWW